MSEERLQKLGVPMGPRIRILQEVQKLQATLRAPREQKYSNFYIV